MDWEREFIAVLKADFERRRRRNPKYSLRQFGQKLNLSAGAISELMRGKRRISVAAAERVIANLDLPKHTRLRLRASMGLPLQIDRQPIKRDDLDVFLDWRNQAILGLLELDDFDRSPEEVARRLGIDVQTVREKIEMYIERGLLRRGQDGKPYRPREDWGGFESVTAEDRIRMRQELLKPMAMAIRSAEQTGAVFMTLHFTGTRAQLDELKERLRKVFDEVSALSEVGPKDELYCLAVQLFPYHFPSR